MEVVEDGSALCSLPAATFVLRTFGNVLRSEISTVFPHCWHLTISARREV
jgi:hypothetical protein